MTEFNATALGLADLHYDLRSPCDDCPFRTDAPWHEGIAAGLINVAHALDDNQFLHTCHKTDSRAECAPERRAPAGTPLQHCAGALIMLELMGKRQEPTETMRELGEYEPERLNMKAPVYPNFARMAAFYALGSAMAHPEMPHAPKLREMAERMLR